MSWWETLHLVTWWKRLGISAIKTGQDAPSWIWCTERLSFFGGGHIVLQRFVHVRCHFQPLPTKLVFAYFDRGSYRFCYCSSYDRGLHELHVIINNMRNKLYDHNPLLELIDTTWRSGDDWQGYKTSAVPAWITVWNLYIIITLLWMWNLFVYTNIYI